MSVVHDHVIAFVAELVIVVPAHVGVGGSHTSRSVSVELLGTTTKEDIGTGPVSPGVIGNTIEEGVDDSAYRAMQSETVQT